MAQWKTKTIQEMERQHHWWTGLNWRLQDWNQLKELTADANSLSAMGRWSVGHGTMACRPWDDGLSTMGRWPIDHERVYRPWDKSLSTMGWRQRAATSLEHKDVTDLVATKAMTVGHANLLTSLATKRVQTHRCVLVTNLSTVQQRHSACNIVKVSLILEQCCQNNCILWRFK